MTDCKWRANRPASWCDLQRTFPKTHASVTREVLSCLGLLYEDLYAGSMLQHDRVLGLLIR
jgi:hypothetical protein